MAKRVGGRADGSAGFPLALDVPVSEGEKGWRSRVQSRTLEGGRTRPPRRTYVRTRANVYTAAEVHGTRD